MAYKLIWSPAARDDLHDIVVFIARDDSKVDETFIGGKARNMHRSERARKIHGTGGLGKVAVMRLLERHGEVRTMVVPNVKRKSEDARRKGGELTHRLALSTST